MEHALKLSILICHLKERKEQLSRLLKNLDSQTAGRPIEIIVEVDNRGEHSVGEKRNILLRKAKGEYVSFIDDDDDVSETYVAKILEAIERSHPDCIGITGKMFVACKGSALFKHSIVYAGWYESDGVYYRTPNHLNPVRRELALQVMFNDNMSIGEDRDYSERLIDLIETEEKLDEVIYFYDCTRQMK